MSAELFGVSFGDFNLLCGQTAATYNFTVMSALSPRNSM